MASMQKSHMEMDAITVRSDLDKYNKILEQGYEIEYVPDEEKREQSRKEVEGYRKCLRNQELVIKQRPETYKLLFVGNTLIVVIGLFITFAVKESRNS